MEKKSKDTLRRYKKSRQHTHSSTDSSSSDTDTGSSSTYSSSDSEHRARASERHRKKKSARRAVSSSGDERRKRDKRDHHVQKKLMAKRNHLKRKLKEARLKKRAAAALSGHGHRALSPATQAKLKKLAERKHLRAASKEQREREKLRAVQRERERDHHRLGSSRSPPTSSTTTTTKIRIHQDVGKRQKSPGMGSVASNSSRMQHQLMSREKIIIQTRTRGRTPSLEREREREREREHERQRHEHKLQRHDDLSLRDRERRDRERERAEREAARDKERAEALARCQERQRERERLAREKMRRQEEEDKKYGRGVPERELDMPPYGSRERSLETVERGGGGGGLGARHVRDKRDIDGYEREQEYMEAERHGLMDDMRRYGGHRRHELSPMPEHYAPRMRDPRDLYTEEERERAYKRAYMDARYTSREREAWLDARELRERELPARDYRELDPEDALYVDERERMLRERERAPPPAPGRGDYRNEWERDWDEENGGGTSTPGRASGFVGGPKRLGLVKPQQTPQQHHSASEPDWDADEQEAAAGNAGVVIKSEPAWLEHDQRDKPRPWQSASDWRDSEESSFARNAANSDAAHHPPSPHHHMHTRGERGRGFRRGGGPGHAHELGERSAAGGYRPHPPPLMTLPVQPPGGYHGGGGGRGFAHKRMPYGAGSFLKKHAHNPAPQAQAHTPLLLQHTPKPPNAAAQASAVAAATTAVAAAKAAAQSAANATTNPGILAQVSKLVSSSHAEDEPAATPEADANEEAVPTTLTTTAESAACNHVLQAEKPNGELSEISDSDDDILNKTDKVKPKCELQLDGALAGMQELSTDALSTEEIKTETLALPNGGAVIKTEEDEVLDFEEISDGELEEDARHKSIGDALGVDWQGLIAETRQQATEYAAQQGAATSTSAKQRWQPHRVLLDMGVSFGMAGAPYARRLIEDARQQLQLERSVEGPATEQKNGQLKLPTHDYREFLASEHVEPLACVQLGLRGAEAERQRLVGNVCGVGSRALSARQDLRLRRQLCGLPARECDFPRNLPLVSDSLRSLALHMFQRTLDVK